MSGLTEEIAGKNCLREIKDLDLSGVSNKADVLGMREAVLELDNANPIDVLFMRGSSSMNSADAAKSMFESSEIYKNYLSLSSIKNGKVYAFMSEPMSGCLSYVGYVLIAESIGVDTGYDPSELIKEYNQKYGFDEKTSGLAFHIEVDGTDVVATQIF
jgi:hypothetical protein